MSIVKSELDKLFRSGRVVCVSYAHGKEYGYLVMYPPLEHERYGLAGKGEHLAFGVNEVNHVDAFSIIPEVTLSESVDSQLEPGGEIPVGSRQDNPGVAQSYPYVIIHEVTGVTLLTYATDDKDAHEKGITYLVGREHYDPDEDLLVVKRIVPNERIII